MRFLLLIFLLLPALSWTANSRQNTFIVSMMDRRVHVISPESISATFSVIVENKSLSKLVGKFATDEGALKYISLESGATETVEIIHKSGTKVFFVPMSPAFQEVELIVGKKEYEIPSQK